MTQAEFKNLYQKYKEGLADESDLAALAPYKVENAIIMAAGMSSRFAPLSYERPKGLLPVKGEVLIERQIRQLHEVGITDITIVVGYLKEQFAYLEGKYGAVIVENEDYYRYNNTSSVIRVLDKLGNSYLCSSDNYFTENVFEAYVYDAYYSAVYLEEKSEEWGLITDEKDYIVGIDHAPEKSWVMMGHVYFSRAFSVRYKEILLAEYVKEATKDLLWEGVYEAHLQELPMQIRRYEDGVILEFDALSDLRAFDETYRTHTGSKILEQIAKELSCKEEEILQIKAVRKSVPDLAFSFTVKEEDYLFAYDALSGIGRIVDHR